jgi:hypothetical protein
MKKSILFLLCLAFSGLTWTMGQWTIDNVPQIGFNSPHNEVDVLGWGIKIPILKSSE